MIFLQNTSNYDKGIAPLKELSLNVLDIAQNSIRAEASLIEISLEISTAENLLKITVKDNGIGFDERIHGASRNNNTSHEKRNGFGIPLFRKSAEETGGRFCITSQKRNGTVVSAVYILNHPDRTPIGDISATIEALILCCRDIDFIYTYKVDDESFILDTARIKELLEDIPITSPEVMEYIRMFLKDNTDRINKTFLKG